MGLEPDQFWRKTPRECRAILKGRAALYEREHNSRMSLAWHTAKLVQVGLSHDKRGRPAKLPPLKSMLVGGRRRRRRMTEDEQWRVMGFIEANMKETRSNGR